ncbi:conserved hypothetical protein [Ancylobacter novellus DSM 506]|uniref:SnoaL-like domain-containing protein n=1 Tax=Ancylobacter novellus (strain ATCC 8093 / DSM 506 / JCM 20403 / CCM 1077 / IAM 12100 / NBRC 12443 / NCIMB 10456) TaxID=639283 RepID=D7A8E1_ANCN5|nr:nuclear transport factor 2 family protein [Ancylobacter novellus]ADH88614.1 conserved hypothetical protein [Ancylobacter novellus DSM 506]
MDATRDDIEQVRRAKARYARFLDTKDWDGFAALFEPNVRVRMFDPAGNIIVSHDDRDSFVEAARVGLEGGQSIHQMHNDEIDRVSEDEISAIWSMEDMIIFRPGSVGPGRMHGYGHYHELWRRGPDGWRIARLELRRTILEFTEK